MSIQDRITVSLEETQLRLEQALDRLRRFSYDSKYRSILGQTVIDNLERWDASIRAQKKEPFTIVVTGEFKRGKSSFVNALLGEQIVTTDVTPETVTINTLRYGIHKNEAILSGGRRLTLQDEELSRCALEKLMEEAGEPIRRLELFRPNERLKDICIVDTPGLNENDVLDELVREALSQADAVIDLYSVTAPLSRDEQMFLRYTVLPQNYTKLFLVGNYADMVGTEENLGRIRDLMQKRTEALLPGEPVYLISALDELCRSFDNPRPCPALSSLLETEFDRLRADIDSLIEDKKSVVVADRMLRMTKLMVQELNEDLSNLEKGMTMDAEQLAAEKSALDAEKAAQIDRLHLLQDKIEQLTADMAQDTKLWMEELLLKLQQEDLSAYSAEDLNQFYAYYCIDTLENALRECLELHREKLLEEMSEISDELSKRLAGTYGGKDSISFRLSLDNTTWTKGDSVTLAITRFSGNSIINAVTDLVGSIVRKQEIENDKGKLLKSIQDQYPLLRDSLARTVSQRYTALARAANKLLAEHYQQQLDRANETLAQYCEAARKNEEEKELARAAICEVQETLKAFEE